MTSPHPESSYKYKLKCDPRGPSWITDTLLSLRKFQGFRVTSQELGTKTRQFLLFIYFWLHWVFITVRGLSLLVASGGYSSLWCAGFSLWWLLLLRSTGSRYAGFSSCGTWALEHRLSSCGSWAYLLHGMWDLPGPGHEPVSPALAGGFLTTAPPGKSVKIKFRSKI